MVVLFKCLITSMPDDESRGMRRGKTAATASHNLLKLHHSGRHRGGFDSSRDMLNSTQQFNWSFLFCFFFLVLFGFAERKRDRWPLNNDQIEDKRHENKKIAKHSFSYIQKQFSFPVSLSNFFSPGCSRVQRCKRKKSIEMRRSRFFFRRW